MRRLFLMSFAVALAPAGLVAQETRQLDAHVHGESSLNLAIEGNAVAMELEAPAMDIVGFEHAPSSDAQKAAIAAATEALSTPLTVFVLPESAGCSVTDVSVKHVFADDHDHEDDHDDHAEHEEGHDDHDDDHAEHEDEHDSHDDEHAEHHDDHDHDGEATHSEFRAVYELTCGNPAAIDAIDFAFFELFPAAEAVEVQVVTDHGQAAFEVERDAPRLELDEVHG